MVTRPELTQQETLSDTAATALPTQLETLPDEILLHIISYLDPTETRDLQLVCRRFLTIARDQELWRWWCFRDSSFLETLDRRRNFHRLATTSPVPVGVLRPSTTPFDGDSNGEKGAASPGLSARVQAGERARIMANWDPSFPSERVSWYDEYIQRHGPITVNWLQMPRIPGDESRIEVVEPRGVALYRPDNAREDDRVETLLAVSPLDDGSVCLWDVNGTRTGRRGAIVARSRPGILFIDGPDADNRRRSKRVDSGVTECVSVDSHRHRAYFAVQSHLIDVDLQTLCVVDLESYPWSITAMSAASPHVPLTVGTSLGIHLHDSRVKQPPRNDSNEFVDGLNTLSAQHFYERSLRNLFLDEPLPPYASLSQPGPLSILHLQRPGQEAGLSDHLYVAGRFSNILHYDRRKFPSIKDTIYSGASLCSMTSLPYPFSSTDSELRRTGQLSQARVKQSKSSENGGRTLIACGDYNTKGALELYGLSSEGSAHLAPGEQNQSHNRSSASRSRLLSVVNHGTRIAVSDGTGFIKWFERDGFTEVRSCRIGHSEMAQGPSIFASMPGSDDIARKLLPTRDAAASRNPGVNDNDLLFWTGDKLGLVRVSAQQPGFTAEDFEGSEDVHLRQEEERAREAERRAYGDMMRQALESQADDARLVRNLGLGSGHYR